MLAVALAVRRAVAVVLAAADGVRVRVVAHTSGVAVEIAAGAPQRQRHDRAVRRQSRRFVTVLHISSFLCAKRYDDRVAPARATRTRQDGATRSWMTRVRRS